MNYIKILPILALVYMISCSKSIDLSTVEIMYTMPDESSVHEGTWLQWPHEYQYGKTYRNALDTTWIAMTAALIGSENIHIIAYDSIEKNRIEALLIAATIPLSTIDFKIYKTDDVWVRDNGPIYARDNDNNIVVEDWGFNGWGNKAAYFNCNSVPQKIAADQGRTLINLNTLMTLEGGAFEIDGRGTLLATKSAILNKNRNKDLTLAELEANLKKYLGVTHFVWLDGAAGLEITDQHIDGFARFASPSTIVTMNEADLLNYDVKQKDITTLYDAKNSQQQAYSFIKLPLTKNNLVTTSGENLGYKGSYVNYYITNTKVLVPVYNDLNDALAIAIVQQIYPTKMIIGIDVRNLYANGGMVHCVTQQQPMYCEIGFMPT